MQREDERQALADVAQHFEQRPERGRVVDVGRPVQRDDAVTAARRRTPTGRRRRAAAFPAGGTASARLASSESIITLPTKCTRDGVDALAREVVVRHALGRVEQIGDLVGQHPVDFLRHRAVEAAQARLDVGDRHALLRPRRACRRASS